MSEDLQQKLNTAEGKIKDLEYELKKAYEIIATKNQEIDAVTTATNTISLEVYEKVKLKYDIAIAKLKKYGMWCNE